MEPVTIRELSLKDYLQILRRRRWVILAFFLICSTTVTIATFLMTPLYRAETKLLIEGESANVRSAEESSVGNNVDALENYIDTQVALIQSDSIAGKVSDEFHLDQTERYKVKTGFMKPFQKWLRDDVHVERVKGSRMIVVGVENPDAKLACDLVNRVAAIYIQDNLRRRALTFIRNQRMAALNDEFLRLQSQLDTLSTRLGPKHPEMIELHQQIRAMAVRIEKERAAETRIYDGEALNDQDQELLEETLLKIQESSVFSSSRMNNISIVDAAGVPDEPIKPKKKLNIIIGILFGLIGGIALAFFVDYWDDTVKTEDDLKRFLPGVPFLGSVFLETRKLPDAVGYEKLMAQVLDSPSVEAYRLIRMNVMWYAMREASLRDLAIVSPGPGEGKTTVVCNLAIALAQAKVRVLLVDTDFRRGRLHTVFNLADPKGLGAYLTEGLTLKQVAVQTDLPGLSLVPCGQSVIDSAQLLGSSQMAKFIQEARSHYDFVIYDTPPVSIISDASILIAQLDGAILSLRCGASNAHVIGRTLSLIRESKVKLIGAILNGVEKADPSSYSAYYSKYYQKISPRR